MGRAGDQSLGELITWLLYLMAFLLPLNTMREETVLLVVGEAYFVVTVARTGRKVTLPEMAGGFLILNTALLLLDLSWEVLQVLSILLTSIFILWGIKLTLGVKE